MSANLKKLLLVVFTLAALPLTSFASTIEFEEDKTLPIVYLNIILQSGAAHDPNDKLGLAAVAGEMFTRGTRKRTKLAVLEELDRLGGEFAVDVRAEGTVFRGAVLAENLDAYLSLIEEILTEPKFDALELQKLKKEVESLILEQKGNDSALARYSFYRFFYEGHPYSHPNTGTRAGVAKIAGPDIVRYYTGRFNGKNLALVGSGDASRNKISNWFDKVLDRLDTLHPEAEKLAAIAEPTGPVGRKALIIDKPSSTQAQVIIGGRGLSKSSPDLYSVQLANYVFGGPTFQARLLTELRAKRGWTYGASNSIQFGKQTRHYALYAMPKTDTTVPAIELSLKLLADMQEKGISKEEFEFARSSLTNNAPFQNENARKRVENATMELLTELPRGYFRDFAEKISKVSEGQVNPAVGKFFEPSNLTIVIVGNAAKIKPALSKIPGIGTVRVKNYRED